MQGEYYSKSSHLPCDEDRGYGYLYVIAKDAKGPCKVGIAVNARRRICALENANGMKFPCLWLSPLCSNYKNLEKYCHERMDKWRGVGEWFDVSFDALADAIMTQLEFDHFTGPDEETLMKAANNIVGMIRPA